MVIKFGVWNNRRSFVHLGRSKFELSSAHEKIGVWNGPYTLIVEKCFMGQVKSL